MKKRGISLIVLVITIIVIVILGTAVIVTFAKNNPIEAAKIAALKGDAKTFNEELTLTFADKKLNDKEFDPEIINAASVEDMKKYIPSFSEKYYGKLCIVNGKLAYVKGNVTENEKTSLKEVGLVPGSYITVEGATDIKTKADDAQIPSDAITTDVTEYIDGIPEDYAEKFTIYQGKIYYRYEKTTYDERVSLYNAGISCFMGDVNGDGMLTNDDSTLLMAFTGYDGDIYPINAYFVGDIDFNGYLSVNDISTIRLTVARPTDYESIIDISLQEPKKMDFLGLNQKLISIYLGSSYNMADYKEIISKCPILTKSEAQKIAFCEGDSYLRYEKLTDVERTLAEEFELSFLMGDGNFDGYVNEKDAELIDKYTQGYTSVLTAEQKKIVDFNKDGKVDLIDYNLIMQYLAGGISYSRLANS